MEEIENLYVNIEVRVYDSSYTWRDNRGKAELTIEVPRLLLMELNLGKTGLVDSLLKSALSDYDAKKEKDGET